MKKLSIIICLFFSIMVLAQSENSPKQISWSISEFLYFDAPRFTVGYVFPLKKEKYYFDVQLGYGNKFLGLDRNSIDYKGSKYQSIEIAPQILKQIGQRKKSRSFLGVNAPFIYHFQHFNRKVVKEDKFQYYRYYDVDYQRIKFSMNFNYIFNFKIYKDLEMWLQGGFGIKFRNINYTHYSSKELWKEYEESDIFNFGADNIYTDKGFFIRPNFEGSIRLCYNLK